MFFTACYTPYLAKLTRAANEEVISVRAGIRNNLEAVKAVVKMDAELFAATATRVPDPLTTPFEIDFELIFGQVQRAFYQEGSRRVLAQGRTAYLEWAESCLIFEEQLQRGIFQPALWDKVSARLTAVLLDPLTASIPGQERSELDILLAAGTEDEIRRMYKLLACVPNESDVELRFLSALQAFYQEGSRRHLVQDGGYSVS